MTRALLTCAVVLFLTPGPSRAENPAIGEGNWLLTYQLTAASEVRLAILKVEKKDGQLTASVLSVPPKSEFTLDRFSADGGAVALAVTRFDLPYTFDGMRDPQNPKAVPGTFGNDTRLYRAKLTLTDKEELTAKDFSAVLEVPEPWRQFQKLPRAVTFRARARKAEDDEEKKKFLAEAEEAQKEFDAKAPVLYREVVAKHADHPIAYDAANALLRRAGKDKAPAEEVVAWAAVLEKQAAPFGPRFRQDTALRLAETLTGLGHDKPALAYAEKAAVGVEKLPAARQARTLQALRAAQEKAGLAEPLKATDARLAKVEEQLDRDYLAKGLPFKPEPFAGRTDGNRVAVLELFTGAECGPCVAADLAFDGLQKRYRPTDVVLIQYHLHIPGPDPLTNADSEARWKYYRERFPEEVRGTPTTAFNGKPATGGGGGRANAGKKYGQYTEEVEPILEGQTPVKLSGSAARSGDSLAIEVALDGLPDNANGFRLRLVLVEETVRYAGSNGIRFHHQVVRAMPGGPEGVAVKDLRGGKHSAKIDLGELRKALTKYLDDYAAEEGPFPTSDRPLALRGLRVIALVQDDGSGEVVQARQFDVVGE